jgi:hypothetical protein
LAVPQAGQGGCPAGPQAGQCAGRAGSRISPSRLTGEGREPVTGAASGLRTRNCGGMRSVKMLELLQEGVRKSLVCGPTPPEPLPAGSIPASFRTGRGGVGIDLCTLRSSDGPSVRSMPGGAAVPSAPPGTAGGSGPPAPSRPETGGLPAPLIAIIVLFAALILGGGGYWFFFVYPEVSRAARTEDPAFTAPPAVTGDGSAAPVPSAVPTEPGATVPDSPGAAPDAVPAQPGDAAVAEGPPGGSAREASPGAFPEAVDATGNHVPE